MTDEEARAEALWTYAISHEKVLRQFVKRGVLPQEEADWMSDQLYEQLNLDDVPGFRISKLGEMMRSKYVPYNPFVSMTEIACEKQMGTPSYLIQSWLRSRNTTDYLKMWEKASNLKFQEAACDELVEKAHSTGLTLTPSLWISTTNAIGLKTVRGKGSGTMAHPEIALMFRAWLFLEFMLELVRWYREFRHGDHDFERRE